MNYKFNYMTTDALKEAKTQIESVLAEKRNELHYLKEEIAELTKQKRRASRILYARETSPYSGEYYICSEFRLQYKKPYRELSPEEKQQYNHDYWEKYTKYKRKSKAKNKEKQ